MGCDMIRQIKHHSYKSLTPILTFVTCLSNNKSTKTVQAHWCCYQEDWLVGFKVTRWNVNFMEQGIVITREPLKTQNCK